MLRKRNQTENSPSTKAGRKLSYGWVVAIAGAGMLLAAGNFLYTFGVFVKPLINKFGWSRAAISGCVSIRSIASGLGSPVVGAFSDRYGPRKFILLGVFLAGLSYLLASRITSLWHLYLFLSILTGIGIASMLVPAVATATRWFGGKSALANGIVMSGFSMAQIILPPIATYLIVQHGWETCFVILGIAAWVLGSMAWNFIRTPPNTVNQPRTEPREGDTPKAGETPSGAKDDYTLSEALRTRTLWIMFLVFMVVTSSYHLVIIHIIAAAIDTGISPEAAAIILTLSGVTNTLGRLTGGGLASKIGNRIVLVFCLAIQALSLFALVGASDLHVFYIIATVCGLAYGGVIPIMPTLAGSFFGTRAIGSIYGTLVTAGTAGVAIGPLLAGYIFDVTGSYSIAFLSATIALAVALLLCLLLKSPRRKALAT